MEDNFMYSLRGEPPAEFARTLETQLERQAQDDAPFAAPRRITRVAALAASVAIVAFAFSFPAVRAAAQSFLDLFRVVNFAAVPVHFDRMQALRTQSLDLPHLIGDQIQVLKQPGHPTTYATPQAASAALHASVKLPSWIPVGWEISQVLVSGEQSARIVANTSKLQQLLHALSIDDLQIPPELDGKVATIDVPPVVSVTYQSDQPSGAGAHTNAEPAVTLLQAASPTVAFPAGVDLATLGEIGLRILGLDRADAYRFAQSIDWRSTLIVPVPIDAASFRQVDVQGHGGLLIERRRASGPEQKPEEMTLLMWSSGDRIFALSGRVPPATALEMAQSID